MSEREKVDSWSLATCAECRMPFGQEAGWATMCPFCFKEKSKYQILKGDLAFAFLQKELHKRQTEAAPAASRPQDTLSEVVLRQRVVALETALAQSQRRAEDLQREVGRLRSRATASPGGSTASPDLSLLRKMIVLCHPDKHKDSPIATEVTQWINGQMTRLRQ